MFHYSLFILFIFFERVGPITSFETSRVRQFSSMFGIHTASCLRIQCSTTGRGLHYRIYDGDGGFGAKDPLPLLVIWNLNLGDDH